jgi:hypothetical protein
VFRLRLKQSVPETVLPGPEAAAQLIEQKTTAIWRTYTAISNLSKIPLFSKYLPYKNSAIPQYNTAIWQHWRETKEEHRG